MTAWQNHTLERMWQKRPWLNLKHHSNIRLVVLGKNHRLVGVPTEVRNRNIQDTNEQGHCCSHAARQGGDDRCSSITIWEHALLQAVSETVTLLPVRVRRDPSFTWCNFTAIFCYDSGTAYSPQRHYMRNRHWSHAQTVPYRLFDVATTNYQSAAGLPARWTAGIRFPAKAQILFFAKTPIPVPGPTEPHIQCRPWASLVAQRQTVKMTSHLGVTNAWNYNSTPPYDPGPGAGIPDHTGNNMLHHNYSLPCMPIFNSFFLKSVRRRHACPTLCDRLLPLYITVISCIRVTFPSTAVSLLCMRTLFQFFKSPGQFSRNYVLTLRHYKPP
jgi:hypothetical protein